ncbi:hypothetical protein INP83_12200 [Mucilaginibacter sp. 21P]|nr:hypothetical protein INP83_12200 [Mucilaginibacter sp. 21P]
MHHIISDGWSMGLLVREILELYRSYSQGGDNLLEPLKVQYKDYAAWHNSQLESGEMKSHGDYWQQQLGGELPLLNLPLDYPRGSIRSYEGDKLRFTLSKEQSDRIRQICSEQEVSLFMFFTALINVLLYSYSGQNDIIVGTTIVNRNDTDLETVIGIFLNSIALRNVLNRKDTFGECLFGVKQTVLDGFNAQAYPIEQILIDLKAEKIENRNPLYDVLLVLNNDGLVNTHNEVNEHLTIGDVSVDEGISKFDLTFFINEKTELEIAIEYSTALFNHATIEGMANKTQALITEIVKDTDQTLNDILWKLSGKTSVPALIDVKELIGEEF